MRALEEKEKAEEGRVEVVVEEEEAAPPELDERLHLEVSSQWNAEEVAERSRAAKLLQRWARRVRRTCTHAHAHMHTCTHAHMHTCTHAHAHAHAHTHTHMHMHTHMHILTYTIIIDACRRAWRRRRRSAPPRPTS